MNQSVLRRDCRQRLSNYIPHNYVSESLFIILTREIMSNETRKVIMAKFSRVNYD